MLTTLPHVRATVPVLPIRATALAAGAIAAAVTPSSTINEVEARLSLMLHTVETRYEADVVKIKSAWNALKANFGKLVVSHVTASGAGAAVAYAFIKHIL
jgi:hypothetical protein